MLAANVVALIVLLFLGAIASLAIAVYAWLQKVIDGNRIFALAMLLVGWWSFAYGMELYVTSATLKLIWAKLQYLSLPLTPTVLIYASFANGYTWQKRLRNVLPIFVIPLLSNLFVWFQQPLIWSSVTETQIGDSMQLDFSYGPWFGVSILTTYGLYVVVAYVVLQYVLHTPRLSRVEAVVLLAGAMTPFLVNLLYLFRIEALQGLDLTPSALVTFGLATAWVVFQIGPIDFRPLVYDAAFRSLPSPAMTVDAYNRVRHLNPAGHLQVSGSGRDTNKVIGGPLSELMPLHWYALVEKANEQEALQYEVERYSNAITEYFDMRITPLRDRRDRYKGRLFVITDITQRKYEQMALAEREKALELMVEVRTTDLTKAYEELVQVVQMKDDFLAGMSHELRTPLSAVIGTTESLQTGIYGMLSAPLVEPIARIEYSASHLLELINDILDVSKLEAGNLELRTEMVSTKALCQACLELIKVDANKKQIMPEFSIDVSQELIEADPRRLRQILLNLLSNAVKFTPKHGQVGLEVIENRNDESIRFAVWDTGIGIEKADQERVFDPFVQVDSSLSREYDGTGLGLALTTSLVKMHGGEINLRSKPGKGSRFEVCIPWRQT